MSDLDTTVIICCAGMGTRLGIGTTKALMHINGKPLIIHQLEALKDYSDIRVVVGYQANKVIEIVNSYRKDIMFAFNNDFKITGPATSLRKGMLNSKKYVLSIDGDILVNPEDFKKLLSVDGEYLAISKRHSEEPILVEVKDNEAIHFSQESNFEWPGIVKLKADKVLNNQEHTFDIIEGLLPIKTVLVRSRDIDTTEDYENALEWVKNGYKE